MKVEIRDITKEEAVPYSDNADIVLAERKAVVFTDDAGNTGKLYMKEEDVELLGEQYIAENSKMEYSEVRSLADLPRMRCLVDGRELHPPERHVSEWDADGNRPLR